MMDYFRLGKGFKKTARLENLSRRVRARPSQELKNRRKATVKIGRNQQLRILPLVQKMDLISLEWLQTILMVDFYVNMRLSKVYQNLLIIDNVEVF